MLSPWETPVSSFLHFFSKSQPFTQRCNLGCLFWCVARRRASLRGNTSHIIVRLRRYQPCGGLKWVENKTPASTTTEQKVEDSSISSYLPAWWIWFKVSLKPENIALQLFNQGFSLSQVGTFCFSEYLCNNIHFAFVEHVGSCSAGGGESDRAAGSSLAAAKEWC